MNLDRHDKGAMTSIFGVLMFVYFGIMHEDVRHSLCACAGRWENITLGMMMLGMTLLISGAGIVYTTPMLTHK